MPNRKVLAICWCQSSVTRWSNGFDLGVRMLCTNDHSGQREDPSDPATLTVTLRGYLQRGKNSPWEAAKFLQHWIIVLFFPPFPPIFVALKNPSLFFVNLNFSDENHFRPVIVLLTLLGAAHSSAVSFPRWANQSRVRFWGHTWNTQPHSRHASTAAFISLDFSPAKLDWCLQGKWGRLRTATSGFPPRASLCVYPHGVSPAEFLCLLKLLLSPSWLLCLLNSIRPETFGIQKASTRSFVTCNFADPI